MRDEAADIADFLGGSGWTEARRAPLAGDASRRRYERLRRRDGACAVLMIAPPASGEDVRPFLHIARHLTAAGLSAPRILAEDAGRGLLLLEDLGDDLFARHLTGAAGDEAALYETAVDLLAALHRIAPPDGIAPYDPAALVERAALAWTWYADRPVKTAFSAALGSHLAALPGLTSVLALRDYHAENLLWLPERAGLARVGLLDFQDAMAGHPAYDLVSLLEDARRDTDPALRPRLIRRYLDATGGAAEPFARALALLGAQRNLRILGVFARLRKRDGKPGYLRLIPRVWGHLMGDLSHPDLADLRAMAEAELPAPTPAHLSSLDAA